MGNAQGQEIKRTIMIDEWEIPEAYKSVAVSEEVVDAVTSSVPKAQPQKIVIAPDPHLNDELEKQRSLNTQLRDELQRLSQIQNRPQTIWNSESREDMEEKKKTFDDTVNKVKQQYFGQQKENVCTDLENQILRCLASNKQTPLNCRPLQFEYQRCVSEHRDKVLQERKA
ncbi:hypothetical protein M3Y97_01133500 [Aphelenchoides bicaudatus]|nr:hypothetical protein M3Y97_01133500 [Aphelenchoides bicaudatus]